jgi:hypothetical protein
MSFRHHKGPVNPNLLYVNFVPAMRELADAGLGTPKNGMLNKRREVHRRLLAAKAPRSRIPLPQPDQGYVNNLAFKRH